MTENRTNRSRAKHRKKKRLGILSFFLRFLVLGVLVVLAWKAGGEALIEHYAYSSETRDLCDWFEVSGDQVRLYVDEEIIWDYTGLEKDGVIYIPASQVGSINRRFFLNADGETISFAVPDSITDIDSSTGFNGHSAFINKEGTAYIALDMVEEMSDLVCEAYFSTEAKRAFLHSGGTVFREAEVLKNTALRSFAGKKAPMLAKLSAKDSVRIVSISGEWTKVLTKDGIIGFAESEKLGTAVESMYPHTYQTEWSGGNMQDRKIVMAWQAVHGENSLENLDKLTAGSEGVLNVISPTWIQINGADGSFSDYSSAEYIAAAHAKGLLVWPSVDNFNQPEAAAGFLTGEYFADRTKRRDFINRLMTTALQHGYDGINLDFEGVPQASGAAYVQFFRELSVSCRKAGIALSIDNYVPYSYNEHYDLAEQGVYADYVIIMGYDEHTSATEPGSVASQPYTEYAVTESLKKVPAEKLIHAVPFYTRVWKIQADGSVSSEAVGMKDALSMAESMNVRFDDETGQYLAEKEEAGARIRIWLENGFSLEEKLKTVRSQGLGGVAAWRLGFQTQEIWKILDLNSDRG